MNTKGIVRNLLVQVSHIKVFLLLSVFAALSLPLFGEEAFAAYISGTVEIQEGNNWRLLSIGESFPQDAHLRLEENSIAEITCGSTKVMLTKAGSYRLDTLIQSREETRSSGVASLLGKKVSSMFRQKPQTQSAVMGARASEAQDESGSISWVQSETKELIKSGKVLLEEGDYSKAEALFEEAFDYADFSEEGEALFYLGYSRYLQGNYGPALEAFDMIFEEEPEANYYPKLILTCGSIYFESQNYPKTASWIETHLDAVPRDQTEILQPLYLMIAYSYMQTEENRQEAEQMLKNAVSAAPESELGITAAAILAEL